MTSIVWVLVVFNLFHVEIAELGQYRSYGACQHAKLTTPVTGLGNWAKCQQRLIQVPIPVPAPVK